MKIKKITIVGLLAISLFACNNSENNLEDKTDNVAVKEPSEVELKTKKLNALTDNFDGFSASAFQAYHSYVSSFGNDADHYNPKGVSEFLEVDPNEVEKLKSLEDILEISVLSELNPLITSYKINARAFSVAINGCERYYSTKGFKNDDFENGRGMHKPVIEIFARFSVADSILRVKSNEILNNLESDQLNKLKKDGLEVEYLSIIGKNEAKKLNRLLTSTSYNDLKLEQLEVFHNQIKNTYDKLSTLKKSDTKQFNARTIAYFNSFEQFYNAFDELYLRKKDKKAFSKKELKKLKENEVIASGVEGSPNKVIVKYEQIIKSYGKNLALL